ncbi:conditioned medium-induced protein 2 [Haladaptatus paucihalophilus DX253]|uniref:Conditioned medium-induced protein 2 n=1 Tax=Haladaptatus paucihalophilus DX253 TaxID=797209 RepID=E7QNI5_HALPU|nr:metalloregulator ArsR/SmtB family transcription factor [Haladaptatus paucihalophilus]EFW94055.1 conditioned medium-induced protein 2 [Haladaptatus paucihalophilus DX253]SHK63182.1 transcriptional regulator, ArsR family [Haladaptatus paucihalophilus DX253]
MDSAALLDILGNENRRRILRLLSHKPCYVTEISDYLGVSPKAVIDHLRKLEEAGLVESRTDDQRRKYFNISRNLRLEVDVSPYEFGMKSAYPASPNLDVSSCQYLSLNVQYLNERVEPADDAEDDIEHDVERISDSEASEVAELAAELNCLEDLKSELSLAQRWVHGRMTSVLDSLSEAVDGDGENRIRAEILAALAAGAETTVEISREIKAPERIVESHLKSMAERGVVERDRENDEWTLTG